MKIMLDSGAFTAYQQKVSINLSDYIAYCQENARFLESYVNLDVIPSTDNPQGWEEAAKQSDRNYQRMKKEGLSPIPVYHFGERRYWLDKLVQEGAPRIGLGGIARRKSSDKKQWLQGCFNYLSQYPVKVHGFGISSLKLLDQYPWDSADSLSWVLTAAMGRITLFQNGKFYTIHLGELSKSEQTLIHTWCKEQKLPLPKVSSEGYRLRYRINIRTMRLYSEQRKGQSRFRTGFFTRPTSSQPLSFFFSLSTWEGSYDLLKIEKASHILISYYNLLNTNLYKRTIQDFAKG